MQTPNPSPAPQPVASSGVGQPPASQIPPVIAPPVDSNAKREDRLTYGEQAERHDFHARRLATYGAIALAVVLYGVGLLMVVSVIQLWPFDCAEASQVTTAGPVLNSCPSRLTKDGWHYFIGALVALFSVPTVLIVSVLRAVRRSDKEAGVDSMHAVLGEKITALVEKIVDKILDK